MISPALVLQVRRREQAARARRHTSMQLHEILIQPKKEVSINLESSKSV
jgi:hypothetical protein